MGEGAERVKPTEARFALAENVKYLMATHQRGFQVGLNAKALEKELRGRVHARTIRRILDPYNAHSPRLDGLDLIAQFFGIPTWELLRRRPSIPFSQEIEVTPTPKPSNARK